MSIFVVSMILHFAAIHGYEFICPDRSHLRIYSKAACANPLEFSCLKDVLVHKYRTLCYESRYIAEGYKYVFRPNYDREKCIPSRYQPFLFYRNQQTDCFYLKSSCNDEGQIMYSSGNTTSDVQCKCDENNGFTFVTQPRNNITCIPSEEDCSCYRKTNNYVTSNDPYNNSRPNHTISDGEGSVGFPPVYRVNEIQDYKETALSNKTKTIIFVAVMLFMIIGVCVIFLWTQVMDDGKEETNMPVQTEGDQISDEKTYKQSEEDLNKDTEDTEKPTERYPSAIYKMDEESRKLYKKTLESGYEIKREVRVIVVGKKEAGKTSLIRRLRSKSINDVKATDGIEIHSIICNDDTLNDISWHEKTQTPDSRMLTCIIQTEKGTNSSQRDGSDKPDSFKQTGNKQTENANVFADKYTEGAEELLTQSDENDELLTQPGSMQTETSLSEKYTGDSGGALQTDKTEKQHRSKQTETASLSEKYIAVSDAINEQSGQSGNKQSAGSSHISVPIETNTIQQDKDANIGQDIEDMKDAYEIDRSEIRISVWDFGGDEEFYYTHQLFLADDVVYLIVTSLEPCDEYSDKFEFQFWFDTIHCLCKDPEQDKLSPRCIVVGTKLDLCQEKNADKVFVEKRESVTKTLRRHIYRKSFLISNKESDIKTINDIKVAVIDAAKEGKEWETKHPMKFILLDKALDKKRCELENRPVITLGDMQDINNMSSQPLTAEELNLYLRYNHLSGHLIYYKDIPDYIVIVPQWLGDLFRCFVTAEKFRPSKLPQHDLEELRSTGKITDTLLKDIFHIKKVDGELQPYLMKIMEKFHIVIQVSQSTEVRSKIYFAPCMVKGRTFDVENFSNEYKIMSTWLCLECSFIPPFLFNHIIISFCEKYRDKGDLPQFYTDGAVLDISTNRCEKLVILRRRNVIQIQIIMIEDQPNRRQCSYIKRFLTETMKELTKTFSMTIKFEFKWKCQDSLNQCSELMKMDDCQEGQIYYCKACATTHIFKNYWDIDIEQQSEAIADLNDLNIEIALKDNKVVHIKDIGKNKSKANANKIGFTVAKRNTVDMRSIHLMAVSPDGSLWIGDNTSKKVQHNKLTGDSITTMSTFNIQPFCLGISPSSSPLTTLKGTSTISIINAITGQTMESKYSITPWLLTCFHITADNNVVAGGIKGYNSVVLVMDKNGKHLSKYEKDKDVPLLTYPACIATTRKEHIFVIDGRFDARNSSRLVMIKPGSRDVFYFTGNDDITTEDRPFKPRSILVTPNDTVLLVNFNTTYLYIMNNEGAYITYYDLASIGIDRPYSLALSPAGNIYVGSVKNVDAPKVAKSTLYELQYSGV